MYMCLINEIKICIIYKLLKLLSLETLIISSFQQKSRQVSN